jgi:hypothetical protein
MRHVTATVIAAVVMMTAPVLLAQTPMKPTAPGTAGDPAWHAVVRLDINFLRRALPSAARCFCTSAAINMAQWPYAHDC